MIIQVDRTIYPDGCIAKAVYALSKDYDCQRSLNGSIENIAITSHDNSATEEDVKHIFLQTLNDYKAREIIAEETKDIRTILYAKAFADSDDFDEEIKS